MLLMEKVVAIASSYHFGKKYDRFHCGGFSRV